jgi:hypothetical protein
MGKNEPALDFGGHGQEGLLHIGGVLSTGFQEWNTERIRQFLSLSDEDVWPNQIILNNGKIYDQHRMHIEPWQLCSRPPSLW